MHRSYRVAMVGACPFPTSQGSQVLMRQLSEAMADRGHDVHLVTYHLGEGVLTPRPRLSHHRSLPLPGYHKIGSGPAWGKIILDLLLLITLIGVVWRKRIDVIHAHNYEALLIGWIVGKLSGLPVVYHSHNVMAAELPTYFRRAWAQRWAARLAHLLDTQLPRRADLCIALSSEAIPYFRAWGVAEDAIRLIPPGIDFCELPPLDLSTVRRQYGLGAGPLVLYTGNLDQYQHLEMLLHSFAQVHTALPDAQLVIASHGEPTLWRSAHGEAADPHAEGVHFIHSHNFAEIRLLLAAADVAVCPRIACFGFPIKLLNYMAAGKPIVVAQGSAKGVQHLENGYVVDNEAHSFAQGILHLLNHHELAARLGDAALATVHGRFQWTHVVQEIELGYASLSRTPRQSPIPNPHSPVS